MATNCMSLAKLTVYTTISMSMYEIGKFIVAIQVYSTLCSLQQIVVTSLQVYSTSDSLTANCWYLQVTDQSVSYYTFSLLTVCFSTNQRAITLFHCWSANQ